MVSFPDKTRYRANYFWFLSGTKIGIIEANFAVFEQNIANKLICSMVKHQHDACRNISGQFFKHDGLLSKNPVRITKKLFKFYLR